MGGKEKTARPDVTPVSTARIAMLHTHAVPIALEPAQSRINAPAAKMGGRETTVTSNASLDFPKTTAMLKHRVEQTAPPALALHQTPALPAMTDIRGTTAHSLAKPDSTGAIA